MDMKVFWRTFFMNALFILAVPLIFARIGFANWALIFYIPMFSLIETVLDMFFYSKEDITKVPETFPWKELWLTIAMNTLLIGICSFVFSNLTQLTAFVTGQNYFAILTITVLTVIILISLLEVFADNFIYRRGRVYDRIK